MKRNNLMSQNIIPGSYIFRKLQCPRRIGLEKLIRRPVALVVLVVRLPEQAKLVNLEELERQWDRRSRRGRCSWRDR